MRLLCSCWLHGSIPSEATKAAKLVGKPVSTAAISNVLRMFIPGRELGRLVHERLDAERRKQSQWREKSAAGGRKSAGLKHSPSKQSSRVVAPVVRKGGSTLLSSSSPSDYVKPSVSNTAASPQCGRNLLFDSLVTAEGGDPFAITTNEAARIGKALSGIRKASPAVTPEEIAARAANYRLHMPHLNGMSAGALVSHWSRCENPPAPKVNGNGAVPWQRNSHEVDHEKPF